MTGQHIGEYIKQTLRDRGMTQSWLADTVSNEGYSLSRQALSQLLDKAELLPSQFERLAKHLPNDFFDSFFELNPSQSRLYNWDTNEPQRGYSSGPRRLKITIEVDPNDFDPTEWDYVSKETKTFLDRIHKQLEGDAHKK